MSLPSTGAASASAPGPLRALHRLEDGVVNAIFLVMALLPLAQIFARKVLANDIPGAGPILQHLTLWAGFLGALLASREDKHLALSTAELLPPGRPRVIARFFAHTVSAAVCVALCYASVKLVEADMEGSHEIIRGVPEWWSEVVMPVGLALISVRFVLSASPRWPLRALALALALSVLLLGGLEDPEGLALPLSLVVLAALLLGAPIFIAMSGVALSLFFADGTPVASVPTETLRLATSPVLPAVPLLTAAGFILSEGGAARRLMRVSRALVGFIPGGTAIVVCVVCAVFTAFTGGSGVTILALGGLVYPILREEKYPEGFSLGLVTASGSLGLLFPPSFPVILYGIAAQIADINAIFVAGLLPGTLLILLVCGFGILTGIRHKTPRTRFELGELGRSAWEAKWELALPLLVGGAILGGLATIVEAAALACAYAAVVQVLIFKDIAPKKLPATVAHGAALVGSVLILLGVALGLTSYFVDAEIPGKVVEWMRAHVETQAGFLIVLNVMLLVLGSVFEIFSAIVILAPLVAPLGVAYGVDPLHLAIVFLANLELGFLFPPMGLNLFLSSSRFEKPLGQLYRNAAPFLLIMAAGVLLVTYVPASTVGILALFGIER